MKRGTLLVGIAGGSASGKSMLAESLRRSFDGKAAVVSQDWYYHDRSGLGSGAHESLNFDHPRAFDHALLRKHLAALRSGKTVFAPQYQYSRHRRLRRTLEVRPGPLILLEGLFVLHDARTRALLDYSVFIDVPADVRLAWRIQRDAARRRIPVTETLRLYDRFVRPMHERFVQPSSKFATCVWTPLTDRRFLARLRRDLKKLLP